MTEARSLKQVICEKLDEEVDLAAEKIAAWLEGHADGYRSPNQRAERQVLLEKARGIRRGDWKNG